MHAVKVRFVTLALSEVESPGCTQSQHFIVGYQKPYVGPSIFFSLETFGLLALPRCAGSTPV